MVEDELKWLVVCSSIFAEANDEVAMGGSRNADP